MYWAALSTDIKKSSVNWSGLPKWMQKAVQYHNKIVETVVNTSKQKYNPHGVECNLLPNAPEGDAYTYVFNHTDMNELKQFVTFLGTDLQEVLHQLRNDDKLMVKNEDLKTRIQEELPKQPKEEDYIKSYETFKLFQTKPYFGGIFIRVGVAFSDEPPIPYIFKRYRGGNFGETSTSYRSSVICLAEKAEEQADYKLISRLVEKDKDDEPGVDVQSVIKECYMEDGQRKFRNLFQSDVITEVTSNIKNVYNRRMSKIKYNEIKDEREEDLVEIAQNAIDASLENNVSSVKGFCVFVEYERALKDKQVLENPHLKLLIEKEYNDVHQKANRVVDKFINEKKDFKGGLVKQKRDSSSMFVILETKGLRSTVQKHAKDLYESFSKLVSSLPVGSCVGFAYGEMQEITMTRDGEGTFTDYFQDSVNLAARMAMRDWSYSTKWGMVEENEHHNRIAFTSTNSGMVDVLVNGLKGSNLPFTLDNIPLSALNAGGDRCIKCISTKYSGWERLKVGDTVAYGNLTFKITKNYGDTFELDNRNKEIVRREDLRKVNKKTFDEKDYNEFKLKL